jgi:hypothetical protein
MKQLAALLCCLLLSAACNSHGGSQSTSPMAASLSSPSPSPTNPEASPRAISVGEAVQGRLDAHGLVNVFELTAPRDGTLLVRLSWTPTQGSLELWLAGILSPRGDSPPVTGQLPVIAGGKYLLRVSDHAAWDYDELHLPYELTTAME